MKQPRQRNEVHLSFIRLLGCVICGRSPVEAAHLRYGDQRAAKRPTGMGEKPSDCWALPLCPEHHREQHSGGEKDFWAKHKIDPVFIALALWRVSGSQELGEQIVRHVNFYS